MSTASPIRRMLQRWMAIGRGRSGRSSRNSACRSRPLRPHEVAELGRHGQSAGGGEPLGDLLDRELAQGPLVDQLRVAAQGQAQHHVGQVDGLAPRARVRLDEGDVDQHHAAVADQQVGRLDVAVGQAGVPQLADDAEALVDDRLVHLGLAELLGFVEELEGDQVLALGGELDDPVGRRRGQAGVAQQPQRIVLLLDQPADGVEGLLVLQAAVQQLPAQLVPPVRAQMAAGVQLAEQDRAAGHPRP